MAENATENNNTEETENVTATTTGGVGIVDEETNEDAGETDVANLDADELAKKVVEQDNEIKKLKATVVEKEKEVREMRDMALRHRAETDNIRKRTAKEIERIRKMANKNLLLKLLDFLDNFERALETKVSEEERPLYDGVMMMHKQFLAFLESEGISEIACLHEEFDPNVHEAMTMEPTKDFDTETVVEVLQKGYRIENDVLRSPKVKIGKPEQ